MDEKEDKRRGASDYEKRKRAARYYWKKETEYLGYYDTRYKTYSTTIELINGKDELDEKYYLGLEILVYEQVVALKHEQVETSITN